MRAVFFDLDDTLYDRKLPFVEAFFQFLKLEQEELGDTTIEEAYEAYITRGNEMFDASAEGKITKTEMHIYRFRKGMEDLGRFYTDEQALFFQSLYEEKQQHIHMSECVSRMLETLHEREVPMGIITNGLSDHQRMKLKTLEIPKWIPEERWFVSGDCDRPKPDPYMYRKAEESLQMQPSDMLFVGDSYEKDIIGALACDWHALWLKKTAPEKESEAQFAGKIVYSEEEMCDALISMFAK